MPGSEERVQQVIREAETLVRQLDVTVQDLIELLRNYSQEQPGDSSDAVQ